eukprot:TRINITY_DN4211_c0_g1_i1.p1 TRINITY_DN4211_c0_g1~~TRINITY_DN4211_c0_g1_i1.p1  ORF type:complete len:113 (+),score=40.50 TRINITY_DN4211_c0_g1_i1:36-374(+)
MAAAAITDVEKEFRQCCFVLKNGKKSDKKPTNQQNLDMYKYFKQATEGDVKGTQPMMVFVQKRAKWDAWNSLKGASAEDAKKAYVAAFKDFDPAIFTRDGHDELKKEKVPTA